MKTIVAAAILAVFCGASLLCTGCGGEKPVAEPHTHAPGEGGHEHSGWWCAEHGMPEKICAQCDSKLAAEFQKKGDWCKQHDRPDSQCFVCHPELEAKFAAEYEAKEGKPPPKPSDG
jgi:cobalt-zinc-cadmium efflux system membrane fusion protein